MVSESIPRRAALGVHRGLAESLLTFAAAAEYHGVEPVCRLEQDLDVPDEALGDEDAVDVRAVADVQQHVGDACGRRLLKGREDAPYAVHLLLHALLLLTNHVLVDRAFGLSDGLRRLRWLGQPHIPEFMYHVALGMPVLVLAIPVNLDKLLEYGRLAAVAPLGVAGRVVVVAVDVAVVLIVAILGTKDGGAERACEVVDVVLAVEGGDVGAAKGASALMAYQAQSSKVVGFAQRILALPIFIFGREEFGRHNLAAVLHGASAADTPSERRNVATARTHPTLEAVQVKRAVQGSHKLAGEGLAALVADARLAAGGTSVSLSR